MNSIELLQIWDTDKSQTFSGSLLYNVCIMSFIFLYICTCYTNEIKFKPISRSKRAIAFRGIAVQLYIINNVCQDLIKVIPKYYITDNVIKPFAAPTPTLGQETIGMLFERKLIEAFSQNVL